MYHVVAGVGRDDDQAAEKAAAIAALPRAADAVRVTVVHATDDPALDPAAVGSVATVLDHLATAGVDAEAITVDGSPTRAVLDAAARVDADCICVGGRRRSPAGKRQLKSGAQQVILRTDLPVLVAGSAD